MFEIPKLDYGYDDLSPYMSAETVEIHYSKHHQTYVNNLNKLIEGTDYVGLDIEQVIKKSSSDKNVGIFNNAGQHYNHTMFFKQLKKSVDFQDGKLKSLIVKDFGSVDNFKEEFVKSSLGLFGSGWVWLVLNKENVLEIKNTLNGETPLLYGGVVLLVIDVWEHAYYLDYKNLRADFVRSTLDNLIDWNLIISRLDSTAEKDIF